jgi:hypothetical protein
MNLTDRRLWEKIVVGISCVIIASVVVAFAVSPGHRIELGTCGPDTMPMAYSADIQPEFATSLLHELGEPEPVKDPALPPLLDYAIRPEIAETLMDRAGIAIAPDSVIGLYEFPDARILLLNRESGITEVLGTGDGVRTFNLTPIPEGSRGYRTNETVKPVQRGDYNSTSEYSVAIDRVDLVLPPPGNATTSLYVVTKTNIDRFFYPDERPLVTITTRSTFYVRYGERVERVTGTSAIDLDPAWKKCSSRTGISGESSRRADIQQTAKLARGSDRILWSRLTVTSADIQQYDTGGQSTSEWMSSDSTGCSC